MTRCSFTHRDVYFGFLDSEVRSWRFNDSPKGLSFEMRIGRSTSLNILIR